MSVGGEVSCRIGLVKSGSVLRCKKWRRVKNEVEEEEDL